MSPSRPPVLIDALNLAYWCGAPPSLRLPLALLAPLRARGIEAQLWFDASARHRLAHEAEVYAALLHHPQWIVEVPARRRADGELLRRARARGAQVVSRDRYRDYRARFRKLIDDPQRLLDGHVRDEHLCVPALALEAPLAASAELAWQALSGSFAAQAPPLDRAD